MMRNEIGSSGPLVFQERLFWKTLLIVSSMFAVLFQSAFVTGCNRTTERAGDAPSAPIAQSEATVAEMLRGQDPSTGYIVRFDDPADALRYQRESEALGVRVEQLDSGGKVLRGVAPRSLLHKIKIPRTAVAMADAPWTVSHPRDTEIRSNQLGTAHAIFADTESDFAQNLLTARAETGVEALRTRFPEADGRGETVAVLDTGIEFGAAGVSSFADGAAKVVGYFDLTDFGKVKIDAVAAGTLATRVSIAGTDYRFDDALKDAAVLGTAVLSESNMAKTMLAPPGIDLNGNRQTNDTWAVALLREKNGELSVWVDVNQDKVFADGDSGTAAGRERLMDFNSTGYTSFLDAWQTPAGSGHALAVSLFLDQGSQGDSKRPTPVSSRDQQTTPNLIQFHTILGGHGTSCASIVAGEKYLDGRIDGMAPKSRLLSIVVDATGRDVYRASTLLQSFLLARDKGATAISVSWGFATADAASARAFAEILDREVASKGIVIGIAAGNSGPGALSAGSDDYIPRLGYALGAAITEAQSRNVYGWLGVTGDHVIDYSSVGPTALGRAVPDLLSPLMTLARSRRTGESGQYVPFGGTSSATPAFVGSVTALLSVLRAQGLPVHANVLKMALLGTARTIDGEHRGRQGMGMLDVNAAYDRYVDLVSKIGRDEVVDYILRAAVRVAGAGTAGSPEYSLPEGIVTHGYLPSANIVISAEFSDNPALAPKDLGSFAEPLKVVVDYATGPEGAPASAEVRWLKTPDVVTIQADGAKFDVAFDAAIEKTPGVYRSEIRLVDRFNSIKIRIPVVVSVPQRPDAQGVITALSSTIEPFGVVTLPIELANAASITLRGSVLAPSGFAGGQIVVSLFDTLGNRVFSAPTKVDGAAVLIDAQTPMLPPGSYEVQIYQRGSVAPQPVQVSLGVEVVAFDVVIDRVRTGDSQDAVFYLRNERGRPVSRAAIRFNGSEETVRLNPSNARQGILDEVGFPAFRGTWTPGPLDNGAKWAGALMQSPLERAISPFRELAVAFVSATSFAPLAWAWMPVQSDTKVSSVTQFFRDFERAKSSESSEPGTGPTDPGAGSEDVLIEAYANVGRWEKISDQPVYMRMRSVWKDAPKFENERGTQLNTDWLLSPVPMAQFQDAAERVVYGDIILFNGQVTVAKVPFTIVLSADLL
jgi:hypothetical protein